MAAYVYVLRSSLTGQHHIGSTGNLQNKIARNNSVTRNIARPGGPWECVYVEVCDCLEDARSRERYLKSLEGLEEKIMILYNRSSDHTGRGAG